jgi:hypothetical protein
MNAADMSKRLAEIEQRFTLGVKIFYDDIEFLIFLEEMGYTGKIRDRARDVLKQINADKAGVR